MHDISSPLAGSVMIVDSLCELARSNGTDSRQLEQLESVARMLDRIKVSVERRREVVKSRE